MTAYDVLQQRRSCQVLHYQEMVQVRVGEDEEEDDDEEEEVEPEEEEEVKAPRGRKFPTTPTARGRRPINGIKANGREGLFNLGNSLTVTGMLIYDRYAILLTLF